MIRNNPVFAAKFTHLTSRDCNQLSAGQAHAAVAVALLRQLHAFVTRRQRWDPAIAAAKTLDVAAAFTRFRTLPDGKAVDQADGAAFGAGPGNAFLAAAG